jgi:hypothetical protein
MFRHILHFLQGDIFVTCLKLCFFCNVTLTQSIKCNIYGCYNVRYAVT